MAKIDIEQIRILAIPKGIYSLTKLEAEAGLSNGIIMKWENASPTLSSLQKLADFLGCGVKDIIKEE